MDSFLQYPPSYYVALKLQRRLIDFVNGTEATANEASSCSDAWLRLEWFKREIRGKPRLKALDASQMLRDAAAKRAARATLATPIEIDATTEVAPDIDKESLSEPTVTAPPTPEPPTSNG